jgi:hypothetical protein
VGRRHEVESLLPCAPTAPPPHAVAPPSRTSSKRRSRAPRRPCLHGGEKKIGLRRRSRLLLAPCSARRSRLLPRPVRFRSPEAASTHRRSIHATGEGGRDELHPCSDLRPPPPTAPASGVEELRAEGWSLQRGAVGTCPSPRARPAAAALLCRRGAPNRALSGGQVKPPPLMCRQARMHAGGSSPLALPLPPSSRQTSPLLRYARAPALLFRARLTVLVHRWPNASEERGDVFLSLLSPQRANCIASCLVCWRGLPWCTVPIGEAKMDLPLALLLGSVLRRRRRLLLELSLCIAKFLI